MKEAGAARRSTGLFALRRVTSALPLIALLAVARVEADETRDWESGPVPQAVIHLAEPAADEVVIMLNLNAFGGNHAGLFAGNLLSDPAGSYVFNRSRDPDWTQPSLADYARYQTVDGPAIRFYRFHPPPATFATIVRRIREAEPTPPLFCASAVQNLLVGLPPFERIARVGWTSPAALRHVLDTFTEGPHPEATCETLDGSPC